MCQAVADLDAELEIGDSVQQAVDRVGVGDFGEPGRRGGDRSKNLVVGREGRRAVAIGWGGGHFGWYQARLFVRGDTELVSSRQFEGFDDGKEMNTLRDSEYA